MSEQDKLIAEIEQCLEDYPYVAYIDHDKRVLKMATSHMERLLAYVKELKTEHALARARLEDLGELPDEDF